MFTQLILHILDEYFIVSCFSIVSLRLTVLRNKPLLTSSKIAVNEVMTWRCE